MDDLDVPKGAIIGIKFYSDGEVAFYNYNCDVWCQYKGYWEPTSWNIEELNNEDTDLKGLDDHDISHSVIWRK